MKKFVLALLAVVLVLGLCTVAMADEVPESEAPKCEHVAAAWTVIEPANCTENAQYQQYCSACDVYFGDVLDASVVTSQADKFAPQHVFEKKVTAPVCGATGKMWEECIICHEKANMVETEVKGHNVINYKKVYPTCTTDGEITYDCADCGAHVVITKATPGYAAELTKTGHSKGSFNAHGLTVNNKAGYEWRAQDYVAPTCTEDGHVIFTCSHVDPNTGKACDYSKTEYFAKIDHKKADGTSAWVKGAPVEGAEKTCTADGLAHYTCSINGCQKIDVDKTSGHAFKAWEVRVEATCELAGLKYRECTVCKDSRNGKYYEETEVIPALGHDIAEVKVLKAATCTEEGTEFGACKRCLKTVTTTTEALGHDWSEWTVTECLKTRTCERAGCEAFEAVAINCPADPETPADPDAPAGDDDENDSEGTGSSTGSGSDASIPATGDNTSNVPYIMMVAAVAGLVVLVASKRKVNC